MLKFSSIINKRLLAQGDEKKLETPTEKVNLYIITSQIVR